MRRVTGMAVLAAVVLAAPLAAESKREEAQKLIQTLRTDKKAEKRAYAAQLLGGLGALDAVPALGEALRDPDANVRTRASYSLWQLKDSAEPARAAIRAAVDAETNGRSILNEVALLRHLKVDRKELQPAVERALRDASFEVRLDAARALVGDVDPMRLLPIAVEGIAEGSPQFTDSAGLLGDLVKSGDRRLVPPLLELARKGDKRQAAYGADYVLLFKPPPPEALPILQRFLEDRDPETRARAASSLQRLGKGAKPAVPRLTQLLKDQSEDVREEAAEALAGIGLAAQSAIPALIEAFETTRKRQAREACARALAAMGPLAKSAVPALTKELNNPGGDAFLHNTVARALMHIGPKS